jgi:uncharacterized membrane protein
MVKTICVFSLLVCLGAFVDIEPFLNQIDVQLDADAVQSMNVQEMEVVEENSSDFVLFIGRFHPLFVHLPIGFLIFAFLLECVSMIKRYESLNQAVPFALLMGAGSGVAAGVTGYLLSSSGGYGQDLLSIHQWLGISVVVISIVAFLLRVTLYDQKRYRRIFRVLLVMMVITVMGTGHYGGSLTHGSDYLFRYMPEPLQSWIGVEPEEEEEIDLIEDLETAIVYEDIIAPIITTRCQSCHNPDRTEGELLLTSYEHFMEGGESGAVVVSHNPQQSEFYTRLLLPERDEKRMPPRGRRQLTSDQIRLIAWWIEQGLPNSEMVSEVEIPDEMTSVFENLTVDGQHLFDRVQVAQADTEIIENLRGQGFRISPIAENFTFLQVGLTQSRNSIRAEEIEALLPLSEQITWIDLSRADVSDSDLINLSEFKHLTRLSLQLTNITDQTLSVIRDLEHLEYLNLYGTEITDQGLEYLESLTNLNTLYLWQTNVSIEAAEKLERKLSEIHINMGASMDVVSFD